MILKSIDNLQILEKIDKVKLENDGIDSMNTKTIKTFNRCLKKSIWPNALKIAEIVILFKLGKIHH